MPSGKSSQILGRLLCNVVQKSSVYHVIIVAEDNMITLESTKILPHGIINYCTVLWYLINQTPGSVLETAFLNCFSSP